MGTLTLGKVSVLFCTFVWLYSYKQTMANEYIVSARKYRPDTFASIVGQGAMASTLRTAVLSGRMAHAYLFCGPRGVGKTTAARVLAKTINCLDLQSNGEACNQCESCRGFNEQRSFNIFELDAASNNGVDEIRNLTDQVAIPPSLGKYKVYIIDEVHMLSSQAFNAFLKTLEEPPAHAIFILATTEKHKIIPTILSRCQIYDFKRITVMDIVRHLQYVALQEGLQAEEAALGLIAEKADGGMRDALSMFDRVASYSPGEITYTQTLDSLNILDYTYYNRFVQYLIQGSYTELLLLLDELLGKGFDGQIIVGGLANFMRDLLVLQHPSTASLLEKPESVRAIYLQTAQQASTVALHQGLKLLVACDSQYKAASNKRLLVELTLLNLLGVFAPNALGSGVQVVPQQPTPQPAPNIGQAQGQSIQPTTPSAVAQAQQVAQPTQPTPKQPATPPPPTPQPAPSISTAVTAGIRAARQPIRGGVRRSAQGASTAQTPSEQQPEEPEPREDQPFDEPRLQQAWYAFLEQPHIEEQVIAVKMMKQVQAWPRLISPTIAEVALSNSETIIAPVQALLPEATAYLRRELHNSQIELKIRPLAPEEVKRIPITPQERYEALTERYPEVERLRTSLNLRLI